LTLETVHVLLAEYHALREEVVKRIEIMYQIYALALFCPYFFLLAIAIISVVVTGIALLHNL
jgi:hypothetical protein